MPRLVRVDGSRNTGSRRRITVVNPLSKERLPMKPGVLLTGSALVNAVFLTLHVADDIARGIDTIGLHSLILLSVLGLLMCGALVLAGRLWGYLLQLLLALIGLGVVVIHLKGSHMGQIAASSGGVLFVWVLFVLGTSSFMSVSLCLHGLLTSRTGKARP